MKKLFIMMCIAASIAMPANARQTFETDKINTSAGELEISFIGHGTLRDCKIITWPLLNI